MRLLLSVLILGLGLLRPAIAQPSEADYLLLEGLIPGQYLGLNKNRAHLGALIINRKTRLIEAIETHPRVIAQWRLQKSVQSLSLHRQGKWDLIYPGLIDLHNHTKQNNLGVWKDAKGQFANRFEWRAWAPYTKAVSQNMNPWINYGAAMSCAAFRWSEIQAMVVGTTYLQGPSHCVGSFAIHRVEDKTAYVSAKEGVQAPTDLIFPNDMVFVWNTLGPRIREIQGQFRPGSRDHQLAYEQALAETINQHCDFTEQGIAINRETVRGEALSLLKDQALLLRLCRAPLPDKFIRYVYWVHPTIVVKKLYAESIRRGLGSAILSHLAEGRSDDHYNQIEFEIIQLLGLAQKGVHFIHGIGISAQGLRIMGENQMGLIWSPFSNLLLYNETLDVATAVQNKVLLAIGSDWLPTGSKGPLEELKVARQYLLKTGIGKELEALSPGQCLDEILYKMVTENPAKLINHWQNGADQSPWQNGEGQGGIGTLAVGAMGSVIVMSQHHQNPYTNLVQKAWESDLNLVVIDGKVQYGNLSYLNQLGLQNQYEILPNGEAKMSALQQFPVPILAQRTTQPSPEESEQFLAELGRLVIDLASAARSEVLCQMEEPKGFVFQTSLALEPKLAEFQKSSGLNLDRFQDIQRLIGINLMTQSINRTDPERGDPNYQVQEFTPLYTCDDPSHFKRLMGFVSADPSDQQDEWTFNESMRLHRIQEQGLGGVAERLKERYPHPH